MIEKGVGLLVFSGLVAWLLFPGFINLLRKWHFGQYIREEGPQDHQSKAGTPNFGGLLFIGIAIVLILIYVPLTWPVKVFLVLMAANSLVGFLDDWLEIKNKRSLGLKARHKLIWQIFLGLVLAYALFQTPDSSWLFLPIVGKVAVAKWLAVFLAVGVMVATTNAVNLTDGLDGLASGLCSIALLVYACIAYQTGKFELCLAALILAGTCLGFLWYNTNPAKIFMGDTGSLGLGGALAVLAVFTRTELLFLVIGGVFLLEALSVMIQVTYFKLSKGKRVFLMSPLHHHFGQQGYPEPLVVVRFWITGLFLALIGLMIFWGMK